VVKILIYANIRWFVPQDKLVTGTFYAQITRTVCAAHLGSCFWTGPPWLEQNRSRSHSIQRQHSEIDCNQ